jgi:hypothetical protein
MIIILTDDGLGNIPTDDDDEVLDSSMGKRQ